MWRGMSPGPEEDNGWWVSMKRPLTAMFKGAETCGGCLGQEVRGSRHCGSFHSLRCEALAGGTGGVRKIDFRTF